MKRLWSAGVKKSLYGLMTSPVVENGGAEDMMLKSGYRLGKKEMVERICLLHWQHEGCAKCLTVITRFA